VFVVGTKGAECPQNRTKQGTKSDTIEGEGNGRKTKKIDRSQAQGEKRKREWVRKRTRPGIHIRRREQDLQYEMVLV
jgi:hypothetical protein